ncbi:MAG: hypothetical protein IJW86_09470 [Clostridia bacterium]|nr:hypothetical protein [Clostridia bacterium]
MGLGVCTPLSQLRKLCCDISPFRGDEICDIDLLLRQLVAPERGDVKDTFMWT